jgi:hypothetical protein
MDSQFHIVGQRSPNWGEQECKRRLAACYRLILSYQSKKEAADGDTVAVDPSAASEPPPLQSAT